MVTVLRAEQLLLHDDMKGEIPVVEGVNWRCGVWRFVRHGCSSVVREFRPHDGYRVLILCRRTSPLRQCDYQSLHHRGTALRHPSIWILATCVGRLRHKHTRRQAGAEELSPSSSASAGYSNPDDQLCFVKPDGQHSCFCDVRRVGLRNPDRTRRELQYHHKV